MTEPIQANKIYYNFLNTSDKHFFSGVFNSFIMNWDLGFQQVYTQLTSKPTSQEASVLIDLLFRDAESKSLTDKAYCIDKLTYYFPFIKVFDQSNFAQLGTLLIDIYKQAKRYRHYTNHYNRDIDAFNQDLCQPIDTVLLAAVLYNRSLRKHAHAKDQIRSHYKESIQDIVQTTNERLKAKRKPPVKEEDGYAHAVNQVANTFLFTKNGVELLDNKFITTTEEEHLTQMSLFIFLSFGLTRQQLEQVLDVSRFFKGTQSLAHAFNRWVATTYCFRQAKGNLSSQFSKDALLLQIADELSKCPKPLFEHLSEPHKNEFIEELNTYVQEINQEDKEISHWITRMRYEEKFAYLAIRFLDEYIPFKTLRFQVSIGQYRHDSRKKYLSTGKESIRNIDEKISVFERLSEVHLKKYQFLKEAAQEEETGWRLFPKPRYQFHKNNIGIWFEADNIPEHRLPITQRDKASKYKIAEDLGLKDQVKAPLAFLSFNELPALLHEVLIKKTSPDDIEKVLKKKYFEKKNGSIRKGQLKSQKMTDFNRLESENLEYIIQTDKLKRALKTAIDYRPINHIRSAYTREIKGDKRMYSSVEKGKIANWLVKDITRYTESKYRKHWKGWQIAEFQRLLAFYDTHKDELKTFVEEELFDYYRGLMFTAFNFETKTLEHFTNTYLKERKKFLLGINRQLSTDKMTKDHIIFDAFKRKNYIVTLSYKSNLLNMPMYLPRGIFDDKPTFVNENSTQQQKAEWFEYANKALENKQAFYTYPRLYSFGGKDMKYTGDSGVTQQFYAVKGTDAYKQRGVIYKNEKQLRAIQRQDVFLLDMFKYGLQEDVGHLTLQNCFKTKEEKKVTEEESQKNQTSSEDSMTYKDNFLLTRRVELGLFKNRVQGIVALKDLPKYRRLEEDNRVETFVGYEEERTFSFTEITRELEAYNRVRNHQLMKAIHKLEDQIYQVAYSKQEVDALMQVSNGEAHLNFKMYLSYFYLSDEVKSKFNAFSFPSESFESFKETFAHCADYDLILPLAHVVLIRNKFAHNQYSKADWFKNLKQLMGVEHIDPSQSYADFILTALKAIIEKVEVYQTVVSTAK